MIYEDTYLHSLYPLFSGINEGFLDGLTVGRLEGFREGFREGLKSGQEFGNRLGNNSFLPLLQILQASGSNQSEIDTSRKLLSEIGAIVLENVEDPAKETRLNQIEAKIKAVAVNFRKRISKSDISKSVNANKSNNKSIKDELSF